MIYPNLFFSFLFYPILFCPYFIQSYPILSHSFLFSSILSYSILFYPVLSYSVLILFYPILSRFTILSCAYHIISCTYPILSLSPIEHILCTALSHPVCPYPHLFRPDLTQLVLLYHSVSRRSHIKSVLLVLSHTCYSIPTYRPFLFLLFHPIRF